MQAQRIAEIIKMYCCQWCPRTPPQEGWSMTLDEEGKQLILADNWQEKALRKLEEIIEDDSDIAMCEWMLEDAIERQIPQEWIAKRRRALININKVKGDIIEVSHWLKTELNKEKN